MAGLGYERYGAQGGDWGASVTTALALADAEHVAGINQNFIMRLAQPPVPLSELSDAGRTYLAEVARWVDAEGGYAHIQGTRPQTLGYGVTDSPVGLAGWIAEKFRVWSDCAGDVDAVFTRDELLTNISIYWFTGNITSSLRWYKERALGSLPLGSTSRSPRWLSRRVRVEKSIISLSARTRVRADSRSGESEVPTLWRGVPAQATKPPAAALRLLVSILPTIEEHRRGDADQLLMEVPG